MKAKHLNESLFHGRQLTVEPKRKNIRGMGRGGGFSRGRGNPRALFSQFMSLFGRGMGFRGGFRGRGGGGFRGRGRGGGGPQGDGAPQHKED
jgi:polyadenylate-binding protein 2